MYKLWASIKKDLLVLTRDRVGLALMFIMPIVLAIVIASVQNSTYELVNNKKVAILIANKDTGAAGKVFVSGIEKGGMFIVHTLPVNTTVEALRQRIQDKEALVGIIIPANYSTAVDAKAVAVAQQALGGIAPATDSTVAGPAVQHTPLQLHYHPVLQKSFVQGINSAVSSVLQVVQSKYIVRNLYSGINEQAAIPDSLEQQILHNATPVEEVAAGKNKVAAVPNATQHNIPAWTIFAMFFVVISLGSSIVKEKTSGSFLRLKTMPTSVSLAFVSKQVVYVAITILQAIVIFSIGRWLFPVIGLPMLNIPKDVLGLLLVTFLCGWCAASFAICIGVFTKTQEQCNGVGAIAIVLFAAIGGLLVPSFAMPESFKYVMMASPLHWCLEAFYGLFLEGGKLGDLAMNLIPLVSIIGLLQVIAFWGMKKQRLV